MVSLRDQFEKKKQEKTMKDLIRSNPRTPKDQYNLAGFLMKEGPNKDEKLSFSWLKKAAEQNYAEAQFSLGYYFSKGIGVKKDS